MQNLDAQFLATIGATATRPLILIEIMFSAPLRIATREVTWANHIWQAARSLTVDGLGQDGAGKVWASAKIGNHDRLMSGYFLNDDAPKAAAIWEAWLDQAGDMHIVQSLNGRCWPVSINDQLAVVQFSGGAHAHGPRLMLRDLIPYPPPKPVGYTFTWGGQTYTLEARQ